nr:MULTISPECIES: nucleotidyltransferase substrate binding protein [unclassified Nitratiruptor]
MKEAYRAHLIGDDEIILNMVENRNLSSHIYDQKRSEEIFERTKKVYISYLNNINFKKWL